MSKADVTAVKSEVKARRYRGVDAHERISDRRQQLIEAGLECFGTRGYHAVTVRELCAQAQLTERYFYESFKDREALFAAVYQNLILKLRADFMAAAAPLSPSLEQMARAGLGVFFRLLKRDPRVARMLLVEVLTVSREMEHLAQHATFGFGDLLKQMSVAALPAGVKSGQDLDLLATGLIGSSVHIAMRWTMDGCRQPVGKVIDTAMAIYQAVIAQLGAAPKH